MHLKLRKYFTLLLLLLSFSLLACNKNTNKPAKTKDQQVNKPSVQSLRNPTLFKFKNKVFSVPSPIQVSMIVKKMNVPFDPSYLNPAKNYSKYLTTFKQAVNLGIYGTNLAYANIYDQMSYFSDYFDVIKKLSQSLGLFNSIDQKTLDRIEKNSENKDSLAYIISTMFRDLDTYLTENQQQKLGALILAGGWVESAYLASQLYLKYKSKQLLQFIGEQKAPLNNLIQLLNPFYKNGDKDIDHLFEALVDISTYYDSITMKYQYQAPEIYPDKHLTIIHSKTIVNIDKLDIEKVSQKIYKLRSWLVK